MRNFIKWLADISGVTKRIELEERVRIGSNLIQDAYWWNGGITYKEPIYEVANFSTLYGEELKSGVYNPNIYSIRDDIYKMKSQNLIIWEDREVYGYWSDENKPYFISKEDYKGEEGYTPKLRIKWK
ncbi:MAG: hypothetical protein CMH22_06100 [Methylophaga sp.]|nr:hypothetical protein [Methylophaga sp.]|tara:strand:+ start:51085 stop:51465 length:381 start_codon:yes stop_codon:yes gene_type:complete